MFNLPIKEKVALEPPLTVWMAANKTSFTLFATEELANRFVSGFPPSVGGGMHVSSVPVFGDTSQAKEKTIEPQNSGYRCTARVHDNNGIITTESCKTKQPLIDRGSNSSGDCDYYECPDCGKKITAYYGY